MSRKRIHSNTFALSSSKKLRFAEQDSLHILPIDVPVPTDEEDELQFELETIKGRKGKRSLKLDGYNDDDESSDNNEVDLFQDEDNNQLQKDSDSSLRYLSIHEIEGQEFSNSSLIQDQDILDEDDITLNENQDITNQDITNQDIKELRHGEGRTKKQVAIEAFNMKTEMEQGKFDENGNYIQNTSIDDPNIFHDSWLHDIRKSDIDKAKQAKERQIEKQKYIDKKDIASKMSRVDISLEIIPLLLRGENVMEALQRYGKESKMIKGPIEKKKRRKRKVKQDDIVEETTKLSSCNDNQLEEIKRKIERLTDMADRMMALGHFNIYEDTWEGLCRRIRKSNKVNQDWKPPSADNTNTNTTT